MSILFYCDWPNKQEWIRQFRKKFYNKKIYIWPNIKNKTKIEYAIVWNIHKKAWKQLPNLKLIFSLGAGVDHLFDKEKLPNVPIVRLKDDIMAQRMSNYVKAQILNYQLKLYQFFINKKNCYWDEQFDVFDNNNLKIGILGMGYIGSHIAKELRKMDYRIHAFKKTKPIKKNNFKVYFLKKHLKRFISTSDIIINILPKTLETKNFVNRNFLNSMKKKSLLINIGRGDTIDENALIKYSRKNKNFMAILDVFKNEPLKKNHFFWKQKNIMITPHIAGITNIESAVKEIYNIYMNFKKTGKLKNAIDINKQY